MTEEIRIDIDPNGWTFFEQMDFRKIVGVNPHYAVMKIGEALETGDRAEFANVPPDWLLCLAWVTARRDEPDLTFADMAPRFDYNALLGAVTVAAIALAKENGLDPTPAPNRAARRAKKSSPISTTSRAKKPSSTSASGSAAGSEKTS